MQRRDRRRRNEVRDSSEGQGAAGVLNRSLGGRNGLEGGGQESDGLQQHLDEAPCETKFEVSVLICAPARARGPPSACVESTIGVGRDRAAEVIGTPAAAAAVYGTSRCHVGPVSDRMEWARVR